MIQALNVLLTILTAVAALLLPGLAWGTILRTEGAESSEGAVERLLRAAGISIIVVPLTAFWLALVFTMPINRFTLILLIAGLTALPIGYREARRRLSSS